MLNVHLKGGSARGSAAQLAVSVHCAPARLWSGINPTQAPAPAAAAAAAAWA